jgi:hypothetical protein
MSWLTDIVSGGISKVIDTVGGVIDKLHTSEEEKLQIKLELQKELNRMEIEQLNAAGKYEMELSERHKNDMASDSWLSKNVRPLALIFWTIAAVALAYLVIFVLKDDPGIMSIVSPFLELFKIILLAIYAFYFGGRTWEKLTNIKG